MGEVEGEVEVNVELQKRVGKAVSHDDSPHSFLSPTRASFFGCIHPH